MTTKVNNNRPAPIDTKRSTDSDTDSSVSFGTAPSKTPSSWQSTPHNSSPLSNRLPRLTDVVSPKSFYREGAHTGAVLHNHLGSSKPSHKQGPMHDLSPVRLPKKLPVAPQTSTQAPSQQAKTSKTAPLLSPTTKQTTAPTSPLQQSTSPEKVFRTFITKVTYGKVLYEMTLNIPVEASNEKPATDQAMEKAIEVYKDAFMKHFTKTVSKDEAFAPGKNFEIQLTANGYNAKVTNPEKTLSATDKKARRLSSAILSGEVEKIEKVNQRVVAPNTKPKATASSASPPAVIAKPPEEKTELPDPYIPPVSVNPTLSSPLPLAKSVVPLINTTRTFCFFNSAFQMWASNPIIRHELQNHPELFKEGRNNPLYEALCEYWKRQDLPNPEPMNLQESLFPYFWKKGPIFNKDNKDSYNDAHEALQCFENELIDLNIDLTKEKNKDQAPVVRNLIKNACSSLCLYAEIRPMFAYRKENAIEWASLLENDEGLSRRVLPVTKMDPSIPGSFEDQYLKSMITQHYSPDYDLKPGETLERKRQKEIVDSNGDPLNVECLYKQEVFIKEPAVLTIHVNRNKQTGEAYRLPGSKKSVPATAISQKDTTPLDVPETLRGKTLTSFCCHIGTGINDGHYISYVRVGNEYFSHNDLRQPIVEEIELKDFLDAAKTASILVYSQTEQPPATSGPSKKKSPVGDFFDPN